MLRVLQRPFFQLFQASTLLFFLTMVATSWGQTGPPSSRKGGPGAERGPKPKLVTLFGVVQDAETQEALPFASVVVVSARDSSVLDGVLSSEEPPVVPANCRAFPARQWRHAARPQCGRRPARCSTDAPQARMSVPL